MTIYSLGISCLAIEHLMISESARRAQNLGNAKLTGNALLCYQKVFWVLYFVEKVSSFHFGRNSVFCDHDIVFSVPSVPEAIFDGFDWFLTCVRYARLLSRAATSLFSPGVLGNPKTYYLAAIDQLEDELKSWCWLMPESVRPGEISGRNLTHLNNVMRTAAIWMSCLHHSLRLSLCRATLHLESDAKEVVSPTRQATATRTMMEAARSILELATFVDVEPYTPLWVIGGIPLTSYFVLFDFVINNPKSAETTTNLALLDIAGGHFSRIEYASGGSLPGSLINGFAHIAREHVNSVICDGGRAPQHLALLAADQDSRVDAALRKSHPVTEDVNILFPEATSTNPFSTPGSFSAMTPDPSLMADEFPLMDTLFFPINDIPIEADGLYGAGTDIMDLFNTYIPGIDPGFFNQPSDDYFIQQPWN
ncbi:hypothetical protein TruAng_008592 [Truncatella angustata]|nr:hypothetical protein TruAng_008592 [Truncatella angustata]